MRLISFILLVFFSVCMSCSKLNENYPPNNNQLFEKFFSFKKNGDTTIQKISVALKKSHIIVSDISDFILRYGYIAWEDAITISSPKGILSILPLVKGDTKKVSVFLFVKISLMDENPIINLYDEQNIKNYGFSTREDTFDAKKVKSILNYFNYRMFKQYLIKINDERFLSDSLQKKIIAKGINKYYGVYRVPENLNQVNAKKTNSYSSCFGYWEETDWWYNPDGDACNCNGDEYYSFTSYNYVSICYSSDGYSYFGTNEPIPSRNMPGEGGGGGEMIETEIFANFQSLENYSDVSSNYTTGAYDNTLIPDFDPQNQIWPNISNVLPIHQFVKYDGVSNCLDLALLQIAKKGYQISEYFSDQTFVTFTESMGINKNAAKNGVSYLISALQRGIPVIVGVNYKPGSPNSETDNTTDHFIVIVGAGSDSNGVYFTFFDNASNFVSKGASTSNKLYYNPNTGTIRGQTSVTYRNGQKLPLYTVTQIRKSK